MRLTLTLLYFSLSLIILSTYIKAYNPVDNFIINCGSSGSGYLDEYEARLWIGDADPAMISPQHTTVSAPANTPGPSTNRLFSATARLSRSQFKYSFLVSNGPKFLRLYFYSTSYQGGFNREDASFTVKSNGFTLLRDFNASLTADAEAKAKGLGTIFREYTINVVDGEKLELTLTPTTSSSYAFINEIEVVSMPSDLYYTPSTEPGFKLVGRENNNSLYSVATSVALETSYRFNVGGETISSDKDTAGLFRTWEANEAGPAPLNGEVNITVTPDYVAPKELYRTSFGSEMTNLTWEFPVDACFTYMLRLHFCELEYYGHGVFVIYVAGKIAEDRADVMKWSSNQRGVAVQRNYAVIIPKNSNSNNHKKVNISLSLQMYHEDYSHPFLNGLEIFKISDEASNNLAGPNPDPLPTRPSPQLPTTFHPGEPDKTHHVSAVIIAPVCVASGVAVLIFIMYYFRRRLRKEGSKAHQEFETFLKNHGPLAIRRYSYSDIKKMSNSFVEKLGQGGYGSVFKGKIHDECLVAVKVLNSSKGNGGEFINEVASISRTSHVNIVTLLGFCFEGSKRALVYEFMSNGSLEKFIYEKNPTAVENQLNCETLYHITIGVARGLEYLHKGCNTRIFHFDIKPHNILLDEKFCPKISDFGLAKICHGNQSLVSMLEARGTPGFIAPEVFSRNFGVVSHKSDVYSFGMMILEMVGGRKNINVEVECYSEIYFPYWIYKRLEKDQELALQCIKNAIDSEMARKMILVSLWCIQTDPSDRPAMSQVVDMLEGSLESLQIPPKPFSSSPRTSPNHYSTSNLECVSVSVNM